MGDYAIRMQLDIDADQDAVVSALGTGPGVESWWSAPVTGSPGEAGDRFTIGFPDVPQPFEFAVERDDDRMLAWETQDFPPWWADTTIRWRIDERPDGPGTRLRFSHEGFDPDDEIVPVITPAWARFLEQLKTYAETGQPREGVE